MISKINIVKNSFDLTDFEQSTLRKIVEAIQKQEMENISTVFPAVAIGVCLIALIFYPMTRKNVNLLMSQLVKKRNGEEYSSKGLEKLL